jgi:hypothetical protein
VLWRDICEVGLNVGLERNASSLSHRTLDIEVAGGRQDHSKVKAEVSLFTQLFVHLC